MLFLYTDFGLEGPYVGQMRAAIAREAPDLNVLDLCHDLAPYNPRAAASLLAALIPHLPEECVVVGVVDPGVGSARAAVVLEADGRCYVGPDNGLFSLAAHQSKTPVWHELDWHPPELSASFHGRDVFAPAGARLAQGKSLPTTPMSNCPVGDDWDADCAEIIYLDHFGNAMTGLRARDFPDGAQLRLANRLIPRVRTFSDVTIGSALCYENSIGLIEIAVNQGSAAEAFNLETGKRVSPLKPGGGTLPG